MKKYLTVIAASLCLLAGPIASAAAAECPCFHNFKTLSGSCKGAGKQGPTTVQKLESYEDGGSELPCGLDEQDVGSTNKGPLGWHYVAQWSSETGSGYCLMDVKKYNTDPPQDIRLTREDLSNVDEYNACAALVCAATNDLGEYPCFIDFP